MSSQAQLTVILLDIAQLVFDGQLQQKRNDLQQGSSSGTRLAINLVIEEDPVGVNDDSVASPESLDAMLTAMAVNEHVLAHLRDGDTELPEKQDLVHRLDLEADFFGLEGLCTSQTGLRRYEVMSANTRIRAVRC